MAVTVPKTSSNHRVDILGKRDHQVYNSSLQLPSPGIGSKGKIWDVPIHVRDWWKRFSFPEKSKLVGGRRKAVKNGDPHRNADLG